MKISNIVIAFLSLCLAGCVSAEEYKKMQEAKTAEEAAQDDKQCVSYGAVPRSVAYLNCRQNLFALREAKKKFDQQQASAAYDNLGQIGAQLLSQPQRPVMNCTSTRQGVFLNTTCN